MKINGKTTKIGLLQIDDYNLKIVKSVLEIWLKMVWELGWKWSGNETTCVSPSTKTQNLTRQTVGAFISRDVDVVT